MTTVTTLPGTEWPDPEPLADSQPPEPFPTDHLPTWLAHYIRAESTATQVPEDMAGMLALSALSTAVQGRLNAIANTNRWSEVVCLYTATVMAPGQRKSAIFDRINAPLLDWELIIQDRERAEVAQSKAEFDELEAAIEKAANKKNKKRQEWLDTRDSDTATPDQVRAAEADLQAARDQEVEARVQFDKYEPLNKTRLVFNDLTPEAAAKAIYEQRGNRIAVISDEGGVFEVLTGARYADRLNLDIFLKGHSGNLVVVDRIGRESEYIRRPIITLGLAIQPSVLQEIGKSRQMHGRGLLARFLYAKPHSPLGERLVDSPHTPPEITQQYRDAMMDICESAEAAVEVKDVELTQEAQAIFWAYQQAIEPRLTPEVGDLDPIVEWASKLAGAILRISALIATARERALPSVIEEDDMMAAVQFSDYLINHAFRAFGTMRLLEDTEEEHKVVRRIKAEALTEFTTAELARKMNITRNMTTDQFDELLSYLERMNYIRKIIDTTKPLRYHWVVNPKILEEN